MKQSQNYNRHTHKQKQRRKGPTDKQELFFEIRKTDRQTERDREEETTYLKEDKMRSQR